MHTYIYSNQITFIPQPLIPSSIWVGLTTVGILFRLLASLVQYEPNTLRLSQGRVIVCYEDITLNNHSTISSGDLNW